MLAEMSRRGVRVVLPGEPEFPSQLLDLPEPPLALWIRGPLDLRAAALRSVAVVGARACTAYGERATAARGRRAGRGRVGGGLGRGVRDRRGGASGGAGCRRPDGCRPRVRGRRRLPPGPRRPARPDRRLGAGRLRAAPGQPAAQAPVPRPQPGDRGAEPGHGRGGGRSAQWRGVDRLASVGARPGGHGRARAGHLDGQLRDQPPAPRAGGQGRQRQRRGRVAAHGVTGVPQEPGAGRWARAWALAPGTARLAGLPDEARAVLEALPSRGTRSVESAAERARRQPSGVPGAPGAAGDRGTRPTRRVADGADVRESWGSMGL